MSDWIRVSSTDVHAIRYDEQRMTIQVSFRSGDVYEYYGTSYAVFLDFLSAASKGQFVHYILTPMYLYQKI